jgi:hypothetical protein
MMATVIKCARNSAVLTLAVSMIIFLFKGLPWASGFLAGGVWASINFVILARVLEAIVMRKGTGGLGLLLAVKFPALYAAGYFLLVWGYMPALALVAGLSFVLFSMGGVLWLTLIRDSRNSLIG